MKKHIHFLLVSATLWLGTGLPAVAAALPATEPAKLPAKPNIVIILVDDMGFSDLGCYGSEIKTPNIDRLAANGMKFSQMYNTAKCYPSRACLQTGVYYQRTDNAEFPNTATLGEVLRPEGYHTWWTGKHHGRFNPVTRGYDHFYGFLGGGEDKFNPWGVTIPGQPAPNGKAKEAEKKGKKGGGKIKPWYDDLKPVTPWQTVKYTTDGYTDKALQWLDESKKDDKPFLLYVAYTAPHYPLQAWPQDIAKYKGIYDAGYAAVRAARYQRQIELGLVDPKTAPLPPVEQKGKKSKDDESVDFKVEAKKMEIYAAMVDNVDQNVGRLVKKLEELGKLDNTLIMFLSDNGGCAEHPKEGPVKPGVEMGSVGTFLSYGREWATASNTPLRKWKTDSFEGGIGTPLVVQWPAGLKPQTGWYREPAHLIDLMPTVAAVSGAKYPGASKQANIHPMDGVSLLPAFQGQSLARPNPLFFQFNNGSAMNDGKWKIVRTGNTAPWELYDMAADRTETHDLAAKRPDLVQKLDAQWKAWWKDCTGKEWTGKAPTEEKDE